ncbi:hypothetical protein [Taibaiella soli]|uniref:Uncharacterized protein n=1 Tax=Taibaiella soli TaxID=1649169 RepID=A0A2W2AXX1_9BACT|nr:hypothetical protein [Taibaiella soli]PZF72874.1 hypothetical protein DN068_10705 [Taibaiella soli]
MKIRNQKYIDRKRAIREMIRFTDIRSFLKASIAIASSAIVKRDMMATLWQLESDKGSVRYASQTA